MKIVSIRPASLRKVLLVVVGVLVAITTYQLNEQHDSISQLVAFRQDLGAAWKKQTWSPSFANRRQEDKPGLHR